MRVCATDTLTPGSLYAFCAQGSNLLFGLPIVLDTDSEDLRVGQKARARLRPAAPLPVRAPAHACV
jgi:hypothetical protein